MYHYHIYNSILESIPLDKLDTGLNNNIQIDVPYEIYFEKTVDYINIITTILY